MKPLRFNPWLPLIVTIVVLAMAIELSPPHYQREAGHGPDATTDAAPVGLAEKADNTQLHVSDSIGARNPDAGLRAHEIPLTRESIEALAETDPALAQTVVASCDDPGLRTELARALLHGWAHENPEAAAVWARHQPFLFPPEALEETLAGACAHPAAGIALARRISETDTGRAEEYGHALILALGERGEFELAATYAQDAPRTLQKSLTADAYRAWARRSPEDATTAALTIADPSVRSRALEAALSGWAAIRPEALAEASVQFPSGAERSSGLQHALRVWMAKDPASAEQWLRTNRSALPEAEAALEN